MFLTEQNKTPKLLGYNSYSKYVCARGKTVFSDDLSCVSLCILKENSGVWVDNTKLVTA